MFATQDNKEIITLPLSHHRFRQTNNSCTYEYSNNSTSAITVGTSTDTEEQKPDSISSDLSQLRNRKQTEDETVTDPISLNSALLPAERCKQDPPKFTPPDGGYGWVVLLAACSVNIWIIGLVKSYSVLYVEILAAYPGSSAFHASWIAALLSTCGRLVGPLVGALCKKYTSRKVSIFGGLLCFAGVFLSAFTTSLTQLVVTMGALTGLGSGFVTTPSILIVNVYFNKRRALASAICFSGNSVGAFFMPQLIEYLLTEYKLRGTLLILSALQLHIVAASCLYRPAAEHAAVQERERLKLATEENMNATGNKIEAEGDKKLHSDSFASVLPENSKTLRKIFKLSDTSDDKLSQNLSLYRSMPLTSSIPDMNEYAQYQRNSISTTQQRKHSTNQAEYIETTNAPSMNGETRSLKRSRRHRSVSESVAYTDASLQNTDPGIRTPDADLQLKSVNNQSLVKQAILHHHSLSNVVSPALNNIKSNVSLVPSESHIPEEDDSFTTDDNVSECQRLNRDRNNSITCAGSVSTSKLGNDCFDAQLYDSDEDTIHTEKHSVTDDGKNNHYRSMLGSCTSALGSCFDVELLKNPQMIIVCISSCLFGMAAPHGVFYVHAYAKNTAIDPSSVTTILSINALVDLVGRMSNGVLADSGICSMGMQYFLNIGTAGACLFCVPFTSSFSMLALTMGVYGWGVGAWAVLSPTILARNFGVDKLPAAYGFVKMLQGIVNFVSPQISGLLVDATGSYGVIYFAMGACMMLCAVIQPKHAPKPTAEVTTEELRAKTEETKA